MEQLFNIIIPTFNRAKFLPKAIESVLFQTMSEWELIIVDDGSTDNTSEVVAQYQDKRIHYIYQENTERSAARNNGIRNAKGEYICFLDSDDYLLPDFLENLKFEIEKKEKKRQIYFYKVLLEKDHKFEIMFDALPENDNIIKYLLQGQKVISVSQCAIPKSFFLNNLFDERYSLWEDTHLFLRLLAQYSYQSLNLDAVIVRQHENSSVAQGMSLVKFTDVERYINAISDLKDNYWNLFEKHVQKKDFSDYIDAKLNMYLYQARVNNQFYEAYQIGVKMMKNKISFYNIVALLKLPIHQLINIFK